MKLLSWNVAHRKSWAAQVDAILSRAPDLIALQEVTARTVLSIWGALNANGFPFVLHSCTRELAPDDCGARAYGELIASRWPMQRIADEDCGLPWPERLLSAMIDTPCGAVELHTAYIPPGSSNGWTKVETFEGIYRRLARPSALPRILCGDFNTPQIERADGRVVTWGECIGDDGAIKVDHESDGRWDQAERSVLCGLADHDLPDIFRQLHGYGVQDGSWFFTRCGRTTGRRFDHIFASGCLKAAACGYVHELRDAGLSDHSAIEACFQPSRCAGC